MEIFNATAFNSLPLENFTSADILMRNEVDETGHWSPLTPPGSIGSNGSPISSELSNINPGNNEDALPIRSTLPISQHQLGEEHGFTVEARGRDLCQRSQMYFVRKDALFQVVVDFSGNIGSFGQYVVRITPSWDIQRPDSDTIIYCCGKHMENGGERLERLSMLKVCGMRCTYEFDETSQRLSVAVPVENKTPSSAFIIPIKSKCFSTCGSNQKKPYHVIAVTLERVDNYGRSIIGRKILNMKFSSSPFRDIKNFVQRDVTQKVGSSPNKRTSSVQDNSQVVLVPVQKKHIETVRLFLQTLERTQAQEENSTVSVPSPQYHDPSTFYLSSPTFSETQGFLSNSGTEPFHDNIELDLEELLGLDIPDWDSSQIQYPSHSVGAIQRH